MSEEQPAEPPRFEAVVDELERLVGQLEAGQLPLDRLGRWRQERIKAALVALPGIGEWTAHMFLIFHLARKDIFPPKDLGIREALRRLDELSERPPPAEASQRAAIWAPYRSTASWYLWASLDGPTVS